MKDKKFEVMHFCECGSDLDGKLLTNQINKKLEENHNWTISNISHAISYLPENPKITVLSALVVFEYADKWPSVSNLAE